MLENTHKKLQTTRKDEMFQCAKIGEKTMEIKEELFSTNMNNTTMAIATERKKYKKKNMDLKMKPCKSIY